MCSLNAHISGATESIWKSLQIFPLFQIWSMHITSVFGIKCRKKTLANILLCFFKKVSSFGSFLWGADERPLPHAIKTNFKYLMSQPAVCSCSRHSYIMHDSWLLRDKQEGGKKTQQCHAQSSISEFQWSAKSLKFIISDNNGNIVLFTYSTFALLIMAQCSCNTDNSKLILRQ